MSVQRSRRVTQLEVAKAANVSQGVVSFILSGRQNGPLNVSDSTRQRVLTKAEELGYRIRAARKKRGSAPVAETKNVLYVDSPPESISSPEYLPFAANLLSGASSRLRERGVGVSVFYLTDEKELMDWLAESDISGVIWRSIESYSSLLRWIAARFPIVGMNRNWNGAIPADTVLVDQGLNITIAADYLWSKGHRQIATFGHVPNAVMFESRMIAYDRFVAAKGVRNYREFQSIQNIEETPLEQHVSWILDIWQEMGAEAPSAMIMSDLYALRIIEAAKRRGIRVPEDLSLIGIDNLDGCTYVNPPLTSMEQHITAVSEAAGEMLLRRMDHPDQPLQTLSLTPTLIERESVSTRSA